MRRQLSYLLCFSMVVSLFSPVALAAGGGETHTLRAHDCRGRAATTVTSFSELKTAVTGGSGEIDLILAPGGNWTATETITVPNGKTLHLRAAAGETVTLTRGGSFLNGPLFDLAAGGRLILGSGAVEYTGETLAAAAQEGKYTVRADAAAGELILDGGAVWGSPADWAPGTNFGDNTGRTAVLYDENGAQKLYHNTGLVASAALVTSAGTVDIWDGVTLRNNVTTGEYGAAIQSNKNSTLNLFGGEVSMCAVASSDGDTGRGAVFVGDFNKSNWNNKLTPTNTHFYMYGGKITRNAASGSGNQDGGGVSVETGYMDLYGGEVSYNHAGVWLEGASSGDGGGFMVRNYAQFRMWGGSVRHNFAGGYGGGVVAWNAELHIHGGEVTRNKAAYGGGLAIASSNNQDGNAPDAISAAATMDGGVIAYNEAINTTSNDHVNTGVGGGICVGSGDRNMGSSLALSGGEIRQNTAQNGGGLGVYAGGGEAQGHVRNTAVTMSGDFRLTNNFADRNGNGMYIINKTSNNRHYLVTMSGGAKVDTNNPVYFANLCTGQVPVYVSDNLTTEGTAAIFELADSFWNNTAAGGYDHAVNGRKLVEFQRDVQENKIALEHTQWYLKMEEGSSTEKGSLCLQTMTDDPQYTIRNGTPVTADGKVYYRIYASLRDAFREAANHDILYIYYNTTIGEPAVLEGKHVTLMAESTSSAGRDAGLSGAGPVKTCWLESSEYGYQVMRGNFLKYVGGTAGDHTVSGSTATKTSGPYQLETDPDGGTAYNVRNDYTITLSRHLYLGESTKGSDAGEGAVVVKTGASLEVGQTATAGMGAGALTFDGNLSSPKEGPMFQTAGTLALHSGITVKNHSNYSMAHPGAVEVKGGGSLTMDEGVTLSGNVSPVAGAVYVANGGSFTMNGGSVTGNDGAMPRYGFFNAAGARLNTYDTAYWGQGKYYSGAGAVYNLGQFTMKGGTLSENRGEYGAIANMGGVMELQRGTISGNHAQTGTGTGSCALTITGYTEGANPAIPGSAQWAENAGSGGGLYQGGGTATVGGGVSITGNTAQNGGGIAVGKGRDLTRTISGYTTVANGQESITSNPDPIAAKVPVYGAAGTALTAPVALTVQTGAFLTDNQAEGLGGGVLAVGSGDSVALESGVTLQRNSAQAGGGAAASRGGAVTFANEVTGNTALYGGGVYVGGGSSVTARGNLTSNQAEHGGGAYVDSGDGDPAGPGPAADGAQAGSLTLDGALVNNNRLRGEGLGVGVYSRGVLELTAAGGSQPTLSYNDRIYLEAGRTVSLAASYDITQSGQNSNNRLTLESRETQNGTQIIRAANADQAAAVLRSGFVTHYTHPMAQNQADKTWLELNAVPVVYYDRFHADGGLGVHCVEVPYASGDTVIFQNFSVGEEAGFTAPDGMSFLHWVTIDEEGRYLDSDGQVVDSPDKAHTYSAGNTIVGIRGKVYLEAVYGTVSYAALLQVLDENGDVVRDDHMGSISLGGATYNSSTGAYTFAMGTPMNVTPVPAMVEGGQTVLQGLTVYERVSQQESSTTDLNINGAWWTPVARAEMEQETLDVPGGGEKTVRATGKITSVTRLKDTVTAGLDAKGGFTYTASDKDILVRAQFKPAMVRLDIAEGNAPAAYTGYYDNMHEAVTATARRVAAGEVNGKAYTFTLLAPNSEDENGNDIVLYYGEAGKEPERCVDNDIVADLQENDVLHAVYDLNGYTLDYQHFGERNLKKYDMTIRNGSVLYHGNTDKSYDPDNDPNGRGPLPAAFRVAEGTLTLENVTIRTTGTPAEGNNDEVYSAKVMEEGTLNIGRGCTLGDVFIYTDPDDIQNATPEQPSEKSGHVTVTNTFVEGRTDLVATLCLRYWDFENQVRRVIVLNDDVAAREGVSIRRMFALKDVDGDDTDHARYWFIGTDGKLYRKAAGLVPDLKTENRGVQEPLTKYWDYTQKEGKHEIGLPSPGTEEPVIDGEPAWINGYPFFYSYYSTYGFDTHTTVSLHAQLKDGEGKDLKIDRGTVAFTVSQITISEGKAGFTDRRNFSGTTGLTAEGSASFGFPVLSELPVSETLDLVNWKRPSSYYVVNAAWAGSGQYAPQYAEFWNFSYGMRENHIGVTGGTLAGALRLSVQGKELADESVQIAAITPRSAEYIGPAGLQAGYTSGPTVGRVVDDSLDRAMVPGTDYNIYFAALTNDRSVTPVYDADGNLLICNYYGTRFRYIAGENGGKIYYTNGGAGTKDGTTPANAKDINGAPAGSYSVALEAETLNSSNYVGQSGWKDTLFTIQPYSGALSITGPNHVVVEEGESYAEEITRAFTIGRAAVTVDDRYGNQLPLEDCAFTFAPISGSAKLDENGWPTAEGLYNLVVTATGHQSGTMTLPDVEQSRDGGSNPNYDPSAAGYLAILITHKELDVFFVPQTVHAPYTGQIYTSDMVKALDREEANVGYQVWKTQVDQHGEPLDEAGNIIDVVDIPTKGADRSRLLSSQYRVEIGSPQHTPREVGDYTMVVTDISGSYIGIGTLEITSEDLGEITLSETEGVYTGVDHTPQVTVTDSKGNVLILNRDYILRLTDQEGRVVSSPINAGTYTYTAVGINNYVSGTNISAQYTVTPKRLDNSDQNLIAGVRGVILDAPAYAITDNYAPLVASYSLYYNGMTLARGENADYDQVITKEGTEVLATRDPGTYLFTITGQGNYAGQTTFTLTVVEGGDSGLRITNTQEYTYNGGIFEDYRWQAAANVNWVSDGSTTRNLDAYQFDVSLQQLDGGSFTPVDNSAPLDAGLYLLTLTPKADYAAMMDLPASLEGSCIFQIRRRPVTITLAEGTKTYGDHDPDFAQQGYSTNLIGAEPNGFYAHDRDSVTGQFSRNTGEDVRNSGYRYTLGSFSAGNNYVLSVSVETVFRIEPKDISTPDHAEDLVHVERRETMSYTGYGLEPIQSVTYAAPRGTLVVADQSGYLPVYERWIPGQPGCVPGCEQAECPHRWEHIAATPTDVAWYRITLDAEACVTTPDNYVGSRSYLFEIQAQGGDLELAVEGADAVTYNRGDHTPVVTVKREGFVLAKEYYTLSYSFAPADGSSVQVGSFTSGKTPFRDAGVYTIYAAGSGNYVGSGGKATFTVLPKSLATGDDQDGTDQVDIGIAEGQSFVYNGRAQQAKITASYLGEALEERDYTLSYHDHVDAGTATVTVNGQGNYTGSRTLTYSIDQQPLQVEVGQATKIYGSADPSYSYTVKNQSGMAVPGVRLTGAVAREDGEDVGAYALNIGTLSAGGNYTLTLSGTPSLTIAKKTIGNGTGTEPAGNISAQAPSYVAAEKTTAGHLKDALAVTYWAPALGQRTLVNGTDYTVTVTQSGTAAPVADDAPLAAGDYVLTITAAGNNYEGTFQQKVKAVAADSLIDLGEAQTLTYSLNGYQKTLTPRVGEGVLDKDCNITVTTNYNSGRTTVSTLSQAADGSFVLPLTDAGTYTVVVTHHTGDQNVYFGTVTYVVQPKDISEGNSGGDGETSFNELQGDFSYTGQEVFPTNAGTLLVYGGETVPAVQGDVTNYIVGYAGNVNPGTATVTVYGQGNYSGVRTTTFTVGEIRYRLRYHANGALTGTAPEDDGLYMKDALATVMGNVNGLAGPAGTVFLGWSDAQLEVIQTREELTGEIYVSGSLYPVGEKDVTLYAVWAADANQNGKADCDEDKYTVTYTYANGDDCTGRVPVDSQPYLSGAAVRVMENVGTLALDGYLLLGWTPVTVRPETLKLENSDAFFTFVSQNALYTAGRSFSMGGGNLTLYAVWGADANGNGKVDWMESKEQYFVSYDGNGGAGTLPLSHALEPETLTVTVAPSYDAAKLTRPGHILLGWTASQKPPQTTEPEEDYMTSGDTYVIRPGDPNPVVFYALWAVDENGNGTPDYEEERYTVAWGNACEAVTVSNLPEPAENRLMGAVIVLPDGLDGQIEDRHAAFLGWTGSREDAAQVYTRNTAPENMLLPGERYPVQGNETLYSVWGEPDYHISQYSVTVAPTPKEGGEAAGDKTAVLSGESVVVTVTVKPGYALSQILINGEPEPLPTSKDQTGRTFELELKDIRENKSVVVAFVRSEFRVVWPNPTTFDQTNQPPTLDVYKSDDTGTKLTAADYTLCVLDGDDEVPFETADRFLHAGTYTIVVEGKENTQYANSRVQVPYVINPAALTEVILKDRERPYKGTAYGDEIAQVKAGALEVPTNGYTALYSGNLNVGEAAVVVAGVGDYTGAQTARFAITAAGDGSLQAAWDETPSLTYDGQPQKPVPTVTNSAGDVLTENLDYTLTYDADVTSAGEKTLTVTGMGNFAGASASLKYTVKAKSLAVGDETDGTAAVTALPLADQTYTGNGLEPVPTLLYGAAPALTLTKDVDLDLTYGSNTAVGTAKVTVTGKGNYKGSRELQFKIVPAGSGLKVAASVERTYNGAGQPLGQEDLKVKLGNAELALGTDYTVSYTAMTGTGAALDNGAPKNAGTYVVTVTAKGSYSGVAQTTLTIAPAKLTALTVDQTTFAYDGAAHAPAIQSVKAGTLTLSETDYAVTYQDAQGTVTTAAPIQAGSYTLVLTGTGNFTGTKKESFTISKGTLLTVGKTSDRDYDGLPYQPSPQIKAGNRELTENVDYVLTYPDDVVNAGDKRVTVTGKGNYEGAEATFAYAINAVSLNDGETIRVSVSDQVYAGTALTPTVVVTHHTADGRVLFLAEDADFTVEYSENLNVGTAKITVTGVEGGNYKDARAATFRITSAGGKNLSVTAEPASLTYTGAALEPTAVTVKDGDTILTKDTDYTLTYQAETGTLDEDGKPLGAGSYDLIVRGLGNYAGDMGTASLVITPAALGTVTVAGDGLVYDGEAKEPAVTVTNGAGEELTQDTDYTVTYSNNLNAGTATVTVAGVGNYAGAKVRTFSVAPAELAITPTVTEKVYGKTDSLAYTAAARSDYAFEGVLTRAAGENVGEYAFDLSTLRETSGNYTLVLADPDVKFEITPKSVEESDMTRTEALTVGYTGQPFTQAIPTVYAAQIGDLLLSSKDYTVTYNGSETPPSAAGTYTVEVSGKGNYSDSYTFDLTISDAVLGVTMTEDTVTYSGGDYGEDMLDRLSASFGGAAVALTADDVTFKDASGASVDEIVNAGAYTVVVKAAGYEAVERPFLVLPKDIGEAAVEGPADTVYDGTAKEPVVTVKDGEALTDADRVLTYRNNTQAGTAQVVITGQGNYTGTVTKTFAIQAKPLADGAVGALRDVVFSGSAQLQKPTVDGLVEGRDYALSYSGGGTDVGSVTVTITGRGNYTGEVERTYSITPKPLAAGWLTVMPGQVTYTGSDQEPLVLVADGSTRLIRDVDYTLAYQDNVEIGTATAKVTGKGNYQGEVSGTFSIAANAASLAVELDRTEAAYTGQNMAPVLTVTSGEAEVAAYTATYTCNGADKGDFDESTRLVDVGVYAITVTGTENYAGATGTVTFAIRPGAFQVASVADQDYTGGPVTPLPAVTRVEDGAPLVRGTDYLLSYANNVALGENTASVTVTGLGNYAGTAETVRFTITGANTLFHVTYDGNDSTAGDLPQDSQGYLAGATATVLDAARLTRLGAVFLGWSVERTPLVTTLAAQEAQTILRPGQSLTLKGNTTLYAVWAADSDHSGRPDYAEQVVITASAGEGGAIAPSGKRTVAWGQERVEYTITVNGGFSFSGVSVDGQAVPVSTPAAPTALTQNGNVYTYVFTDVKEDHVILATFRQNGGGGGGGGTVTPTPTPVQEEPDNGPGAPEKSGVMQWLTVEPHAAYLEGRGEGVFGPNDHMTRAEAAMMFYRLLKDQDVPVTTSFQDVPQDKWYSKAVYTMTSLGFLKGVGGGRFEPERPITRAEFAVLISRMAKQVETGQVREYTDVDTEDWFYDNVQLVSYYGWMAGYPDGSFGPQRNISRGEAAKVINAMTGRRPDRDAIEKGQGDRFHDVSENHWAFYEIVEASTTHGHRRTGSREIWELP